MRRTGIVVVNAETEKCLPLPSNCERRKKKGSRTDDRDATRPIDRTTRGYRTGAKRRTRGVRAQHKDSRSPTEGKARRDGGTEAQGKEGKDGTNGWTDGSPRVAQSRRGIGRAGVGAGGWEVGAVHGSLAGLCARQEGRGEKSPRARLEGKKSQATKQKTRRNQSGRRRKNAISDPRPPPVQVGIRLPLRAHVPRDGDRQALAVLARGGRRESEMPIGRSIDRPTDRRPMFDGLIFDRSCGWPVVPAAAAARGCPSTSIG